MQLTLPRCAQALRLSEPGLPLLLSSPAVMPMRDDWTMQSILWQPCWWRQPCCPGLSTTYTDSCRGWVPARAGVARGTRGCPRGTMNGILAGRMRMCAQSGSSCRQLVRLESTAVCWRGCKIFRLQKPWKRAVLALFAPALCLSVRNPNPSSLHVYTYASQSHCST